MIDTVAAASYIPQVLREKKIPTDQLYFLVDYLDLPEATGDPKAVWEPFQIKFLTNRSQFTCDLKGRQVGWSWIAAAEAVAESCLHPRSTHIFISINQDESREKVRYAKTIIDSLDREVRPKLVIENQQELEFDNGSRILSHPSRPVRGKAKANLYLDEFAHYPKDREIYTAAVPVTTRGGRLRIGSSPLGAHGLFWEVASQSLRKYPGYSRSTIPWWTVTALCTDLEEAKAADKMPTEARVGAFGTKRLQDIFENLLLEDFQQEYECSWVDESVAWIPWEEIQRNQLEDAEGALWYRQAKTYSYALEVIDIVARAVENRKIEASFVGGMDIGRKKNLTEIVLLGRDDGRKLPYRLGISLFGTEFDDQYSIVAKILQVLPVTKFLVDQGGLGMQLAENLKKTFPRVVDGVDFTLDWKSSAAVELKVKMERSEIPLPLDRELGYQIHSIKKLVTSNKTAVFDTARSEKHHADKFWALALAVWAGKAPRGVFFM